VKDVDERKKNKKFVHCSERSCVCIVVGIVLVVVILIEKYFSCLLLLC